MKLYAYTANRQSKKDRKIKFRVNFGAKQGKRAQTYADISSPFNAVQAKSFKILSKRILRGFFSRDKAQMRRHISIRRVLATPHNGKNCKTNFKWILRGFFSRDKAQMRRHISIRRVLATPHNGKNCKTNFKWILRGFFSRDKAQMRRHISIRRAAVTQYRGKKTAKSGDVVEFKVVYTYCVPLLNPLFYKGIQNAAGLQDFLEILQ